MSTTTTDTPSDLNYEKFVIAVSIGSISFGITMLILVVYFLRKCCKDYECVGQCCEHSDEPETEAEPRMLEQQDMDNSVSPDLEMPVTPSAPSESDLPPPLYSSLRRMRNANGEQSNVSVFIGDPPPSYEEVVK